MQTEHAFGSPDWVEWVYSTPPVRDPRGRSRPTQRFKPFCRALQEDMRIEGGNELTVLLFLDILHAAGLVKRFKPQAFLMTEDRHGVGGVPDFMVEWIDGAQHVPEVKSSRFVTMASIRRAERIERFLARYHLRYAVWESDFLGRPLWHNVRQLQERGGLLPDPEAADRLADAVAEGPITFNQLIDAGHDLQLIMHEAWAGRIHFNLLEKRNGNTKLYARAQPQFYDRLFGGRADFDRWWNGLPDH
jgi:hypothetical protein